MIAWMLMKSKQHRRPERKNGEVVDNSLRIMYANILLWLAVLFTSLFVLYHLLLSHHDRYSRSSGVLPSHPFRPLAPQS